MNDDDARQDVNADDGSQTNAGGGSGHRGRAAFVAVVLLLLLLLGVTTVVQTWMTHSEQQILHVTQDLACLQCHTELIPSFSDASVHQPFATKRCTSCHTPHGKRVKTTLVQGASLTWKRVKTLVEWLPLKFVVDVMHPGDAETSTAGSTRITLSNVEGGASELTMPSDQLCWTCHGDMGKMLHYEYPHSPFENGHCTDCHDPHASNHAALLKQDERDLCTTCHPIGPELARKQVHPPVANRFCTDCHDPHASRYKGILVADQKDLCFRCHPTVAPLSLKAVQHQPFMNGECTSCHEPHGSDYMPLLKKPEPTLCYKCHPAIADSFSKPSHHPVGTAGLTCSDCHDPHGADYPGLVSATGNDMCYRCHASTIKASYERSAHKGTLCIRCHTPHGSDWAPILIKDNPDVCLQCHSAAAYDESSSSTYRNNHPVRPKHYDPAAKTGLTCTSTCHDPHGTAYTHMLRGYDYPQDGQCLQCHTRVGIDF